MRNRITAGTEIGFDFTLERVSLHDPVERRTGRGVVLDAEVYSVWPCPGYAVRVTESPHYKVGEVVAITSLSVRPLAPTTSPTGECDPLGCNRPCGRCAERVARSM